MKKLTLLLTVLCFSLTIYGENEYHKFAGKGALWNILTTGSMGYPYEWQSIYILGDSVEFIYGLKHLVVKDAASWNNTTIGGIREDTLTKKVYFYDYINNEVLLYDFSLKVGDTIFYGKQFGNPQSVYYKVVDSICTI